MKNNLYPFVKWAGGKTQLLQKLINIIPSSYNKYYEPFVGGGALMFKLMNKNVVINDINKALINCYVQIRDNLNDVINCIQTLEKEENKHDLYYDIREQYNAKLTRNEYDCNLAGYMIFLNRYCFNGLYRVNKRGEFNVPYNNKNKVNFDYNNMYEASKYLKGITIRNEDFEKVLENAKKQDLIFIDSPYYPNKYYSFTTYNDCGFKEEDHYRLYKVFAELTERGCYCIMTNSNTEIIRELYSQYDIEVINVKRSINVVGNKRNEEEIIIKNY